MVATILMNWENVPSRKLEIKVETFTFQCFHLFIYL